MCLPDTCAGWKRAAATYRQCRCVSQGRKQSDAIFITRSTVREPDGQSNTRMEQRLEMLKVS